MTKVPPPLPASLFIVRVFAVPAKETTPPASKANVPNILSLVTFQREVASMLTSPVPLAKPVHKLSFFNPIVAVPETTSKSPFHAAPSKSTVSLPSKVELSISVLVLFFISPCMKVPLANLRFIIPLLSTLPVKEDPLPR